MHVPVDLVKWKRDMSKKLRERLGPSGELLPDNIPLCPHCNHHCSFDQKTGKLKCKDCDFEVFVKV